MDKHTAKANVMFSASKVHSLDTAKAAMKFKSTTVDFNSQARKIHQLASDLLDIAMEEELEKLFTNLKEYYGTSS